MSHASGLRALASAACEKRERAARGGEQPRPLPLRQNNVCVAGSVKRKRRLMSHKEWNALQHALHGNGERGPRVISKNCNGLQSARKYINFLKHLSFENRRQPIAACLVQEHNLHADDREHHQRLAHHYRILAVIAYCPTGEERGGAAIFIPYASIEIEKGEEREDAIARVAQSKVVGFAGRLAAVTCSIQGIQVKPTSAYAPASNPTLRKQFMLSICKYIDKNSILGIDANCVPDPNIDIRRGATSPYDNAGANELADLVAARDLSDIAREQLGDQPFFTSHHNTSAGVCDSRIDQLYAPNIDKLQWTHSSAESFWTEAAPDHDALQIEAAVATGTRGRDVKRVNENIFDDLTANQEIARILTSTEETYNASSGSFGEHWVKIKVAIVKIADRATATLKTKKAEEDVARDVKIATLETLTSAGQAEAEDLKHLGELRLERRQARTQARSLFMETEQFAVKEGNTHDTGRAAFFRQWTPQNSAQWVEAIMTADWTDPSKPVHKGPHTVEASEIANAFAQYYKPLFADKPPDPKALEIALAALAKGNKVFCPQQQPNAEPT